jgi:hypothetical protein
MINELVNKALIDEAYAWLCKQRKHFPANSDVGDCRFHWSTVKSQLVEALTSNRFNFQPLQKITKSNGGVIHLWISIDSLVLKC